jgi:hypothetical protein
MPSFGAAPAYRRHQRTPPRWTCSTRIWPIVSCATLPTTPIVQGLWLRPHGHLDLIGGFCLRAETDDACRGAVVGGHTERCKSGELLGPGARRVHGQVGRWHAGRPVPWPAQSRL